MIANPSEMFVDTNWFLPVSDMFNIIDKVFHAKTYGKFFIWDEGELPIMLDGRFVPLLWSELLHFYLQQMVLVKGDLIELSDWKARGSLETGKSDRTLDGTLNSKIDDTLNSKTDGSGNINLDGSETNTSKIETDTTENTTGNVKNSGNDNLTGSVTANLDGNVEVVGINHNDTASTSYSQPTETGYKWNDSLDAPSSKSITDGDNNNTTTTTNKNETKTTEDKTNESTSDTTQDKTGNLETNTTQDKKTTNKTDTTNKQTRDDTRNTTKDDVKSDKENQQYDKNMSNRVNDMKNLLTLSLSLYFTNIFYKFERFFIDAGWVEETYG